MLSRFTADRQRTSGLAAGDRLAVGVFEPTQRHKVETLAEEFDDRGHEVRVSSLEDVLQTRSERVESRTFEIVVGIAASLVALSVAVAAFVGAQGSIQLARPQLLFLGCTFLVALLVSAINLSIVRARPRPARIEPALQALVHGGRFALVVRTPASRQPFVEARLRHSGALAVGAI